MKRIAIIVLILSAMSCTKKNDTAKAWVGIWKWESSCGGIVAGCEYPTATNFGTMSFAVNGEFIETHNNSIITKSQYYVTSKSGTSGTFRTEDSYSEEMAFTIDNDKMTVQRGEVTDTYSKVK